MRLHLLGIPHTRTTPAFSHCAFTQKVLKFVPMMRAQGYEISHYGVGEEAPSGAHHIEVMSARRQERLMGFDPLGDPRAFVGNAADVRLPHYLEFNRRLRPLLKANVEPGDLVCLPFGHAHEHGAGDHAGINVETGVGYPQCVTDFRIYESAAWANWHAGKEQRGGRHYEWVIPNYFVRSDWTLDPGPRRYLAYLGRIDPIKGMDILAAIADARPDLELRIAGQGVPPPHLLGRRNVTYVGPLVGTERDTFLGGALALLAPSLYIEPFCGVTVEANFCGTPALTTSFGAFRETIVPGLNGYPCHTLGDFLAGIRWAERLGDADRAFIRLNAEANYSLEAVGPRYTAAFRQIADLQADGWYNTRSHHVPEADEGPSR